MHGLPPRSRPTAVVPDLTRAERRSWTLHHRLSTHLTRSTLTQWRPTILANLERLRGAFEANRTSATSTDGKYWYSDGDVAGLHRVLTGLDRDSIEMREVTPLSGLLSDEERTKVLQEVD